MFEFSDFGIWISDLSFRFMDFGFEFLFLDLGCYYICIFIFYNIYIYILGSRKLMLDTIPKMCL